MCGPFANDALWTYGKKEEGVHDPVCPFVGKLDINLGEFLSGHQAERGNEEQRYDGKQIISEHNVCDLSSEYRFRNIVCQRLFRYNSCEHY